MSRIDFCPHGGMEGIRVSDNELDILAKLMGSKFLDEYIPIPKVSLEIQKDLVNTCKDHNNQVSYWERDNRKHGWCCSHCGTVIQWG